MLSHNKLYYVLVGLVLILFSLSFFTIRFERGFDNLQQAQSAFHEKKIRYDYAGQNSGAMKREIIDLNAEVNQLAARISQLVFEGNNVNDTIIQIIEKAETSSTTLDTLETLQFAMALSEKEVDSLNFLFEEKSDHLIELMGQYESSEMNMNLINSEIQIFSERIWFIKLFLLIYLFFIALGLVTGVFFLIQGLK